MYKGYEIFQIQKIKKLPGKTCEVETVSRKHISNLYPSLLEYLIPRILHLKFAFYQSVFSRSICNHTVLDTVHDSEVNLPGYDILQCDRNRNGGGVAYYIKKDLRFNKRTLHWKDFENLVFDIVLPRPKAITIGGFYRPPNQAKFMDLMVKKFPHLNLKDNEIYLLGDFNINLFQNGKYILNGKRSTTSQGSVHAMINRYR